MPPIRIIPCLDVKNGRTVKGVQFENLRDAGDPAELAALYDRQGADEVCFLDISASQEGRTTLLAAVRRTAQTCFCPLSVGGGVRSLADIRALLLAGADKVSINSAALQDPEFVARAADKYGSQCIIVAIDAKMVAPGRWEAFSHGGRKATGRDVLEFAAQMAAFGAGEILLTSMDRDGGLAGYDTKLLAQVGAVADVPIIASGGVGHLDHFVSGALEGRADALLAASIFHFDRVEIASVKSHLAKAGIWVRPPL